MQIKNKGFTLIELLVVVLIIGILAAIALPMYTKTVEKARLSEMMTVASSMQRSFQRFLLENPSNPMMDTEDTLLALDIDIPGEFISEGSEFFSKNFMLTASCGAGVCTVDICRYSGSKESAAAQYCIVIQTYADAKEGKEAYKDLDLGYSGDTWKNCYCSASGGDEECNSKGYGALCKGLASQGFHSDIP